jgi:GNAT superfamily N-acetyltransferase
MTVALRAAGPGDLAPLAALYRAFFAEDGDAAPTALEERLARILADGGRLHHVVVAETRGGLAGFASVTLAFGVEFGLCAEIEELYVTPTRRGAGLARQLVDAAADWCATRDVGAVYVIVTPEGRRRGLGAAYDRLGFRRPGREALFLDRQGLAVPD